MKRKDILLTWEEFLVILLVHSAVSAKEFSTRTSYIVIYLKDFFETLFEEKNIWRKNRSRKLMDLWIPQKFNFMNTRTDSKPLRTNWWHRLFRCLFKWSVGESKWGSQVHPSHRITWKGHRILGIEPMLLLQLADLLTIIFLFRHFVEKLSKDILNETDILKLE